MSTQFSIHQLFRKELLEKDKSVTICHRNLQTLAYEIFKVKNKMAQKERN